MFTIYLLQMLTTLMSVGRVRVNITARVLIWEVHIDVRVVMVTKATTAI